MKGYKEMNSYRKCPKCGSVRVCWNWCHWDLDKLIELNPHLTRKENEDSQWGHECWDCDSVFETKDEITDGIYYEDLRR